MTTTITNTEIKLMTISELVDFCNNSSLNLEGLFQGAAIKDSFDYEVEIDEINKERIGKAIGRVKWISNEYVHEDDKRNLTEGIVQFVDQGYFVKETIYYVWGDPKKWDYTEVIPEERTVTFYVEK